MVYLCNIVVSHIERMVGSDWLEFSECCTVIVYIIFMFTSFLYMAECWWQVYECECYNLLITVLAKCCNIYRYFSVALLFFFRQLVQAIARPIYTKFGTNVSSCVGFRMHVWNLEKSPKTRSRRAKNIEMKFRGGPSHFRPVWRNG